MTSLSLPDAPRAIVPRGRHWLARNSFDAAFIDDAERASHLVTLAAWRADQ